MEPPLALLSVSDKTGIVDFARGLVGAGYELLSTGGTARALSQAGVPVTEVAAFTGHPEIMEGRVKTLHPRVHGGILGRRDVDAAEAAALDLRWIDVVAVNLYPFERTVMGPDGRPTGAPMGEAMEQVDIGGPTMVRAAAKNHAWVAVLTSPADYGPVMEEIQRGGISAETRGRLAGQAFRHTAAYDGAIAGWLGAASAELVEETGLALRRAQALRYGENPHQRAAFYADPMATGRSLARAIQHQGKQLSFNNLADLDACLRAAFDLPAPSCVVVKHLNPCGAATHSDGAAAAFELALSADPVSAFGGIVSFNVPVDADAVRAVKRSRTFFEVLAAPGFSPEARELLAPRENLRVLELPADWAHGRPSGFDGRRVMGGWLLQDWDIDPIDSYVWTAATRRDADADERATLAFAWALCRNVRSNAIVLARSEGGGLVCNGVGAGQMSRVDSVRLATEKATRSVPGSVLASDAFFPFADGVQVAVAAGVRAFVQPGGSIRDPEVVAAADEVGAAMLMTGRRHFRH